MRYKCLVFDHDDTVVNSTATIHYPCFVQFLKEYYPGESISLEDYFLLNFDPGFVPMCRERYGMTDEQLAFEARYWQDYVRSHVPQAYPGVREIMEAQKAAGGLVCAVSHSFDYNIRRDWAANSLPAPDAVYGWERPMHQRKPHRFPLDDIRERFQLRPHEVLVIDDLKPGYDMAAAAGVDFAAAGWAYDIPAIERFMRENTPHYCKRVADLAEFLEIGGGGEKNTCQTENTVI